MLHLRTHFPNVFIIFLLNSLPLTNCFDFHTAFGIYCFLLVWNLCAWQKAMWVAVEIFKNPIFLFGRLINFLTDCKILFFFVINGNETIIVSICVRINLYKIQLSGNLKSQVSSFQHQIPIALDGAMLLMNYFLGCSVVLLSCLSYPSPS